MLKAARLERKERTPMSKEMLAMIFTYILLTLATLGGFGIAFMFLYFIFQ